MKIKVSTIWLSVLATADRSHNKEPPSRFSRLKMVTLSKVEMP